MALPAYVLSNAPQRIKDQENYLRTRNPYATSANVGGQKVQVAKTFSDLMNAVNFENDFRQRNNSFTVPNFYNIPGMGGGVSGSPFGTTPVGTGGTAAPSNQSQIETLRNIKNPGIAQAVQSLLGEINGTTFDPTARTGQLHSYTRSQQLQDRINTGFGNLDADTAQGRAAVQKLIDEFGLTDEEVKRLTGQDIDAIGQFYDKGPEGVEARLETIRNQNRVRNAEQLGRGLSRIGQARNIGELRGLPSSYLTQQAMDAAGRTIAANNLALSEQERADLLTTTQAQAQLAGRRQQLQDELLKRNLLIPEAVTRLGAANLAQLGQLGQLEGANTYYQFKTPEEQLAQRLGLLGNLTNIDLANTFYGLREPRQEDASGLLPIRSGGSPGGFPIIDSGSLVPPQVQDSLRLQDIIDLIGQQGGGVNPAPTPVTQQQYNQGIDFGAGSLASRLGVPGTTRFVGGQEYIVGPNGQLQLVGADRLTDLQRLYE